MVREHLDNIPQYDLPPPYTIRPYQLGDATTWMRIQLEADQYNPITPALFAEEFGTDPKFWSSDNFFSMMPPVRLSAQPRPGLIPTRDNFMDRCIGWRLSRQCKAADWLNPC